MTLKWTAEEIIRAVRGQFLQEQGWDASGISIDSRTTNPGDLFIAIKGPVHDAHDFVGSAFSKGACAAIVNHSPAQVSPKAPLIFVEDTFSALQDLGRVGRQRSSAKIIAVTGSAGKTSTKEMLRLMLGANGSVHASEGSFNNHWGVPLSLACMPKDSKWGVFEIGMNHVGEISVLTREVQPHVSIITNIEAVHTEYFDTMDDIANAKAEIFLGMDSNGTAVLNRDNPYYANLLAAAKTQGLRNIISFGQNAKSDGRMRECVIDNGQCKITADIMGKEIHYMLNTPAVHMALNSLGALLAAVSAGGDPITCADALSTFRSLPRRGAIHTVTLPGGGNITLLDETFNSNPAAVRAAVKTLVSIPIKDKGRRIAILGDMLELGSKSKQLHIDLAEDLSNAGVDRVHCCGKMTPYIHETMPPHIRGYCADDSKQLTPLVLSDIKDGDIIMVKGSKSTHMELVANAIKTLSCQTASEKLAS